MARYHNTAAFVGGHPVADPSYALKTESIPGLGLPLDRGGGYYLLTALVGSGR